MNNKIMGNKPMLKVQQLGPIKFKDKLNRSRLVINLQHTFGFRPDIIIVDKVHGATNKFIFSAVLPKEKQVDEKSRQKDKRVAKSKKKADSKPSKNR